MSTVISNSNQQLWAFSPAWQWYKPNRHKTFLVSSASIVHVYRQVDGTVPVAGSRGLGVVLVGRGRAVGRGALEVEAAQAHVAQGRTAARNLHLLVRVVGIRRERRLGLHGRDQRLRFGGTITRSGRPLQRDRS